MINVIVMASGQSKRMGSNKLLLPYKSKPIIEHVLDNVLASGLKSVTLVSGQDEVLEIARLKNVRTVYNSHAQDGQSASIKAGILNTPPCQGYMFVAGDQPILDPETISLLAEMFENNKQFITVPVFQGKKGNPVIFPERFKEELLELRGDTGGREIIKKHQDSVLFVEVKNGCVLWDIDTKEDYVKLTGLQNGMGDTVVIRGGGDIASGTIQKLFNCGFNVLVLEIANPTAIRRKVSFCEAVYDGTAVVEGIKAKLAATIPEIKKCWDENIVPVAVDPKGDLIQLLKPGIVVDAILAKKNLGTNRTMAPLTIALGPGFNAGNDVDVVIETMRGHDLGRLIFQGSATENTGIPAAVEGYSIERVIYSPDQGIIENLKEIGDVVSKDDAIAKVNGIEVRAKIPGILRGLIRNGSKVNKNTKIADIDPRISEKANCFTITEKSRSIAGGVLEAILYFRNKEG